MSLKRKAESSKGGGENLNSDFSSALLELAEWEKNVNRNQFKSAAYRKAATVVSGLDYRLQLFTKIIFDQSYLKVIFIKKYASHF